MKINDTDSSPAIRMEHVWVRYHERPVLEDISLTVEEGEILSVVGPNGGGKTTLLHCLVGFVKPFQGRIRVLGKDPSSHHPQGEIGYLPQINQTNRLFPVSAEDVVKMARYARRKPGRRLKSEDHRRVSDVLEKVGMAQWKRHHFGSLSGGQQQRVLIARALALDPRILLLDEPSTGLDAVAQDTFYQILRDIRDEYRLTVLMVSHDIGTVSAFVDRLACLNTRLHFHGKPGDCIPSGTLEKVFGSRFNFIVHDEQCETCGQRP